MATTLTDDELAVPERPENARRASARQTGMYRAVWRWHFYAGLFTIPVIVMLCLSGIVWLFRPQINRALYGNLITVAVAADQTATASYADQLKAVQAVRPSPRSNPRPSPPARPSSISRPRTAGRCRSS